MSAHSRSRRALASAPASSFWRALRYRLKPFRAPASSKSAGMRAVACRGGAAAGLRARPMERRLARLMAYMKDRSAGGKAGSADPHSSAPARWHAAAGRHTSGTSSRWLSF